jgi:hypothetical protein
MRQAGWPFSGSSRPPHGDGVSYRLKGSEFDKEQMEGGGGVLEWGVEESGTRSSD